MDDLPELIFEHAPVGMIYSEDRVIRRCNAAFAEMFGYEAEALRDVSLSVLYPSRAEYDRIGAQGEELMQGAGRYRDERIMRRREGALFWCRVRGQSLTPDQPFARAVWSFADLSQERPAVDLSLRERQVAKLLAEGRASKEIAHDLGLSPRTVEAHRARLLRKMGARNSLDLVARLVGLPL